MAFAAATAGNICTVLGLLLLITKLYKRTKKLFVCESNKEKVEQNQRQAAAVGSGSIRNSTLYTLILKQ